ncbi:MAG TPA: undecaprenyl-diphosphate phosphatase [Candidatus Sulfotelmatobacter sp.]|jgi:undecaprenyl-diphosphatase|nr:undecaprenyl-diphosphate phosphatase [Candidatus Sulfotelmatobacter sp.]
MLTYFQAIIFGMLQGITELFPISSLGHSVVLPRLLGWNIDQNAPFFLTFLIATHTATALVLFFYFFKDWKLIIAGILRSLKEREIKENDANAKLGWLLVITTIPAGVLGILFEKTFQNLFSNPQLVAGMLFLNGLLLLGAELVRKKRKEQTAAHSNERIAKLTWSQAIKIGLLQSIALIPGFSRTGATLTGGLLVGLAHEDSVRFAFLLATPIIGAASVLKLPELAGTSEKVVLLPILIGAITSGVAAYFSVKFLTKYFETKTVTPFAIYCCVLGAVLSVLFFFH